MHFFDGAVFNLQRAVVRTNDLLAWSAFKAIDDFLNRLQIAGALFHDFAVRIEHVTFGRCFRDQVLNQAMQFCRCSISAWAPVSLARVSIRAAFNAAMSSGSCSARSAMRVTPAQSR